MTTSMSNLSQMNAYDNLRNKNTLSALKKSYNLPALANSRTNRMLVEAIEKQRNLTPMRMRNPAFGSPVKLQTQVIPVIKEQQVVANKSGQKNRYLLKRQTFNA